MMPNSLQPAVAVVSHPIKDKFTTQAATQMKRISTLHICLGLLCVLCATILIIFEAAGYYGKRGTYAYFGYGIWTGSFFAMVGGIGIQAAKSNKTGWITAVLVLNIITSSSFALALIGMSSAGIAITGLNTCGYNSSLLCDKIYTSIAFNSLLLAMGMVEFVLSIWSGALCCNVVCSSCKAYTGGPIHYYHSDALPLHLRIGSSRGIAPPTHYRICSKDKHYPIELLLNASAVHLSTHRIELP